MLCTYYLCCQENCTCLVSVTLTAYIQFRFIPLCSTYLPPNIAARFFWPELVFFLVAGAATAIVYSNWYSNASMAYAILGFSLLKQNRHNLKMISDVENSWRIFCVKAAGVFEIEIQFCTQLVAFSSYVLLQIFVLFFLFFPLSPLVRPSSSWSAFGSMSCVLCVCVWRALWFPLARLPTKIHTRNGAVTHHCNIH